MAHGKDSANKHATPELIGVVVKTLQAVSKELHHMGFEALELGVDEVIWELQGYTSGKVKAASKLSTWDSKPKECLKDPVEVLTDDDTEPDTEPAP